MRPLFSLFLLIAFSLGLKAQTIDYTSYQPYDINAGDFSVVGHIGEVLYTYRSSSDGYFLDAWNDKLALQYTIKLDFFPPKINETKFITYPDKIIVLYQAAERNKIVQYAALLDGEARLQGRPMQLDKVGSGFFGANKNYFSSTISEDKSKILVYGSKVSGSKLEVSGILLSDSLTRLHTFSTRYEREGNIAHTDAIVSNAGIIYVPVYHPVGNGSFSEAATLLELEAPARSFKSTFIPLHGKFASNMYARLDNAKNLVFIAGFYGSAKNGNYDGIISTQYSTDNKSLEEVKFLPFSQATKEAAGNRRTDKAFNDFTIRQLIVKSDGGLVVVAENFFTRIRNGGYGYGYYSFYGPVMSAPSIQEFFYNDVFVVSYSGQGAEEWQNFIRKEQYSQEDGGAFSSYAFFNTGPSLGFLFNDFNTRKSTIQMSMIGSSGVLDTKSANAGSKDDPDWLPRFGKQTAAREIIIPCLRKKQICFARVQF